MTAPFALLALLLLIASPAVAAPPLASSSVDPQMVLHLLDYVAADYPDAVKDGRVVSQDEYAEQLELVTRAREMLARLPAPPEGAALRSRGDELVALVEAKRSGEDVAALVQRVRQELVTAYGVEVAPRRAPDVRAAAALYAIKCAACHGAEGRGDGPAAKGLKPPPASFHDRERLARRSVHGLFGTITLGVPGTAMAGDPSLSDEQRWGLALHVAGLGVPAPDLVRGAELWRSGTARAVFVDLPAVMTASETDIAGRHGADAVKVLAYLRSRPDEITAGEHPLARSARLLHESLAAYRAGRAQAAQDLAVASYLDGFELAEPGLDTVNPRLRRTVEAEMLAYRRLLRDGRPVGEVEAQARTIGAHLDEARALLSAGGLPAMAGFTGALIVLFREGLEAILIVAAIGAVLVKAGRRDALPYVHAGWVAALAAGGVTWVVAARVIALSGATREVTEGVTALAACAVLLYVGQWMHRHAQAERWRSFLDRHVGAALSRRTKWALASLAFLAVYREAFETVLLSEALWQHAGASGQSGALAGFATAAGGLLGAGWLIVRSGRRLPLGAFFGATSALLALLAVVLAGKGMAALQEAGVMPLSPVGIPALPLVGLYPSAQGLGLQAALIIVIAAMFVHTRQETKSA